MNAIEAIKEMVGLVQRLDNIELIKGMLTLQTQVQELDAENRRLCRENERLGGLLEFAKGLSFRAPFYYAAGDETPFCPRCWESEKRAIHAILIFRQSDTRWDCPHCKQTYLIRGVSKKQSSQWNLNQD